MFNRKKIITGLLWRFAERIGAQGVSFVVSLFLARLLDPSAYGLVAIVSVITTILYVFVDSGMGGALIQKKGADDLDFSSVFYFNMFMCAVLYIIVFFAAPFIAKFYDSESLIPMIRVMGLTLVISGVKNIQQAYVSKTMQFKRFFFATIGGTVFSAFVGVFMAYKGFGAWALIAQGLTNSVIDTIVLWVTVKWRPKKMFSFKRLKGLFKFGSRTLLVSLIDTAYNNLRALIIGKVYTPADLAFYDKGKKFPELVITNINTSLDSVLFPAMSEVQDEKESLKAMTRRSMKISTYLITPMLIGLATCGKALISLVLTDKWLPAYPFMVVFCVAFVFYPMQTANWNAIKASGRSDLFLKLEIPKKAIGIVSIFITMRISVFAMAISFLIVSISSQIINTLPNKKIMNYGYLEQLKDVLPSIVLSVFMGGCVYSVNFLHLSNIITLIMQVPLGIAIYFGISYFFKLEAFSYCVNLGKSALKKGLGRNK